MKQKGLGLIFVLVILSFTIINVSAQINSTEEQQKVSKAYSCLTDKIQEKQCASLSTEEKIFSLLSIDSCGSELVSVSAPTNSGECWTASSGGSCRVKTTAQAVLALDNSGSSTAGAESWLLNQTGTPTELQWFLEIDPSGTASCQVSYSGVSSTVNIGEDKKLSSNAGPCLVLAQDNYWLRVSPSCYDETFSVSCNQDFLTTLLFRKSNSDTIHVSPESNSAASQGTTTEKVESTCFEENGACSYEGTLWASLVLDSLGHDVSSAFPYLITSAEDNQRFLPDAFLYFITSDTQYRTSILSEQKSNQYWLESGDKLYDTAVALYPFQSEDFKEKTNSKQWLLNTQDSNGCWENNLRDTAFILASLWPKTFTGGTGTSIPSCEVSGYYCTSSAACSGSGGEIFSDYSCPSLYNCCSVKPQEVTCPESGGIICSSNQICRGGDSIGTADLSSGEICCVGGSCEAGTGGTAQLSECELGGNVCRSFGCNDNEESITLTCSFTGDVCCTQKTPSSGGKSYLWIWILLVLIVFVVIGIIFRNRLRMLWVKIKSKFGGSSAGNAPPRGPPHYPPSRRPPAGPFMQRRIILPAPQKQVQRQALRRKSGAEKELDDVLKKLKDMSK